MARLRRDERFSKERVQQWATSGLSAREFASREGLRDSATSLIARYSLAPVAILAIAAVGWWAVFRLAIG